MNADLKEAEQLKGKGNEYFERGDISSAISAYSQALALTEALCNGVRTANDSIVAEVAREPLETGDTQVPPPSVVLTAACSLRCVLFSNLSNLFLHQKDFTRSWETAGAAIKLDPLAIKPWLRYVEARRQAGFPFDAFVTQLQFVRPLIRKYLEEGNLSATEASSLLLRVETPLFRDLGLTAVHDGLELIKHLNGIALITRQPLKANEVLFIERKFFTPFEDENEWEENEQTSENNSPLSSKQERSTLIKVCRYAKRLRPHQQRLSDEWMLFQAQMRGAWPRNLRQDITHEMMNEIFPVMRSEYPDLEEKELLDLMHTALICRFNGFQDGFFRTCALANHSCFANAAMKYRPDIHSEVMQTVRDIQANELINVKYLSDAHFLMGVGKRREYLHSWLFWCQCSRCLEDQQEDAEAEKVACPSCGAYVVHPFTPNSQEEDEKLLEICAKPCAFCGTPLDNWGEMHSPVLHRLLVNMTQSTQLGSDAALGKWLHEGLEIIILLKVHPCHWLYRVMFYFYCSSVARRVLPSVFGQLKKGDRQPGVALALFQPYGVQDMYVKQVLATYASSAAAKGEKANASVNSNSTRSTLLTTPVLKSLCEEGSDILNALIIFWHHVCSFYPPKELWAVHKAICQLVLLHLIYQDPKSTKNIVTVRYGLEILQRHGKYLEVEDGVELMHFFSENKSFAVDPKALPAVSKLKKVFK